MIIFIDLLLHVIIRLFKFHRGVYERGGFVKSVFVGILLLGSQSFAGTFYHGKWDGYCRYLIDGKSFVDSYQINADGTGVYTLKTYPDLRCTGKETSENYKFTYTEKSSKEKSPTKSLKANGKIVFKFESYDVGNGEAKVILWDHGVLQVVSKKDGRSTISDYTKAE
jgi:hypothetical protein